jgi:hypothetical protein
VIVGTYRHDPAKRCSFNTDDWNARKSRHAPKDIDADVEHGHEEAKSLEEVADEEDTKYAGIGWVHDT